MPTMAEVRAKFPQYDDMDDATLAGALHSKFYSDIPRAEFNAKIGLAPAAADPLAIAAEKPSGPYGTADAAAAGALDSVTFGLLDELGAGVAYGINQLPGGDGASYGDILAKTRGTLKQAEDEHPNAYMAGQIGGAVGSGLGLAKGGLSLAANAAQRGAGLTRIAATSAVDGAIVGGITGAGKGEGLSGRLTGARDGALVGGVVGGVAPYAVAGATAAAKPLIAPVAARLRPQSYSNAALGEALKRSGSTPDDIARQLSEAAADGQGAFTVADALGNSGQRMLSTVTRTPNNARQGVVEQMLSRQAGQGRRVTNALAEGFDAPDTAAQRAASLTASRDSAADVAYEAARQGATGVDVSPALATIDDVLKPGITGVARVQSNIADDSVEGVLSRARSLLSDGKSNLSDFNSVLRAKQDIDDMIGRATRAGSGNQARNLMKVKSELDKSLSAASPAYAGARDAFRSGSKAIDAVDTGAMAARRGRSEDTRKIFDALSEEEKAGFRVGYSNVLIENTQGAASGVNKVRPLINDAAADEFPAFAAPGKADQLARRVEREQRMFETQNQAMGGSRTADNLADMEDMSQFDPAMISRLLRGDIVGAGLATLTKAMNEAKGLPPSVLERVAKGLTETNPDAAKKLLTVAATKSLNDLGRQKAATTILRSLGAGSGASPASP